MLPFGDKTRYFLQHLPVFPTFPGGAVGAGCWGGGTRVTPAGDASLKMDSEIFVFLYFPVDVILLDGALFNSTSYNERSELVSI